MVNLNKILIKFYNYFFKVKFNNKILKKNKFSQTFFIFFVNKN